MTERKKSDVLLGGRTSGLDGTYLNNNKKDLMDLTGSNQPNFEKNNDFSVGDEDVSHVGCWLRRMSTKDAGYPPRMWEILPPPRLTNLHLHLVRLHFDLGQVPFCDPRDARGAGK